MYKFTIPVFGEGIVYDSPLDERQQQVKLLVHSMNTKGLEAMVPKMIDEAEDYFRAWGDEGEVRTQTQHRVPSLTPEPQPQPQHLAPTLNSQHPAPNLTPPPRWSCARSSPS